MQNNGQLVKRTTAVILATSFSYAFVNSVTSVLINDLVEAFSLTGAAQGLLSSLLNVGLMVAFLVNPLFQGRVGKVTMILVSGLLQVAALLLSGSVTGFVLFAAAIMLMGVGCGWLDGYINSCIIDLHPADNPRYLGLLHGIFGIGSLLAPVVIQQVTARTNWRVTLALIAGLVLLAMAGVALAGRKTAVAGLLGRGQEERLSPNQVLDYLKSGRNLLLLACGFMTTMVQTGLICWIARYMLLAHNESALGATCLTIYWVAATLNRFVAPRLRVRPLVLIAGGSVLTAVFLAVGLLSGSAAMMCLCFGLLGLVTGHFMPMIISECAQGYQGSTTLTTSVMMLVMGVARVIVPLLMAAVTDRVSVSLGMAIPGFAALLAAAFCLLAIKAKR